MKTFVLAVSLVAIAGTVNAAPIYKSTDMTCKQTQSVVRQHGSAVLKRPSKILPSVLVWDTYVAGGHRCESREIVKMTSVPTRDKKHCKVFVCGYDDTRQKERQRDRQQPDPTHGLF